MIPSRNLWLRRSLHNFLSAIVGLLIAFPANGQEVVSRLDLDRRDPVPQFLEYVAADGGLVTIGNQSRKSSRYLSINKYDEQFNKS